MTDSGFRTGGMIAISANSGWNILNFRRDPRLRCCDNRSAVPIAEIKRWEALGIVTCLGETEDVRPFIMADAYLQALR